MKEIIKNTIKNAIAIKSHLLHDEDFVHKIQAASEMILGSLNSGHKVLIFGNGGSAADSQHFAAELVGRFQKERRAAAALALTTDTSIITALSNDHSFEKIFERQIEALGEKDDLAIAISTSGKAKNVIAGVQAAKEKGLKTLGLTGGRGGDLAKIADLCLSVPAPTTARIQEVHILIIHILCEIVEASL